MMSAYLVLVMAVQSAEDVDSLASLLKESHTDAPLFVRAEPDVPFGVVLQTIDKARGAGWKTIRLVGVKPEDVAEEAAEEAGIPNLATSALSEKRGDPDPARSSSTSVRTADSSSMDNA